MPEWRRLRLKALRRTFAICRLDPDRPVPPGLGGGELFAMARTADELSIVCEEDLVPEGARCEKGWRAFAVQGPLAFSETGVLASLAGPLGEAGISIFAISTFGTDYVLVPAEDFSRAVAALELAGHEMSDH
jgi:hypothetical protein